MAALAPSNTTERYTLSAGLQQNHDQAALGNLQIDTLDQAQVRVNPTTPTCKTNIMWPLKPITFFFDK